MARLSTAPENPRSAYQEGRFFETLYFSNILEEEVRPETANADGWYEIPVRGFEIVTVGMR
ncbi:MAG: hypothetical protein ACLURV_07145 [Gallintestinimicrobium sp.]